MIKLRKAVKIKVEIYFEKVKPNQLVYSNDSAYIYIEDLDKLEENLLTIIRIDGNLIDEAPCNYIVVINNVKHVVDLDNETNDYLRTELHCEG